MSYPIRSGHEVELGAIAAAHPSLCERIELNPLTRQTHDGNGLYGLRISAVPGPVQPPAAIVIGGLHAREWAPPDALLSFARNLVEAYADSKPITLPRFRHVDVGLGMGGVFATAERVYPEVTLPWPKVRDILENLVVYIAPMMNPDGRLFSHSVPGWRKNRRPATASCTTDWLTDFLNWANNQSGTLTGEGVDLNRNFGEPSSSSPPSPSHVLWDFDEYYSADGRLGVVASSDPCDLRQVFRGPSPGSEPETAAVQDLIKSLKPRWFLDVHSFSRKVFYAWATDHNGSDPSQSFTNPAWNRSGAHGGRDGKRGDTYREYVSDSAPEFLKTNLETHAETISTGIRRCAGGAGSNPEVIRRSTYVPEQSISLYPHTGSSADYVFSQQFLPGGWGPVYAYTIECGSQSDGEGGFQPPRQMFPKIEREVHAGVFTFLSIAANDALGGGPAPGP